MNRTEHILTVISEECAEIQKNVSKALRFGLDDTNPNNGLTNAELLKREINDLFGMIELLSEDQYGLDMNFERELINDKQKKFEKYLEYSKERGTFDQGERKLGETESILLRELDKYAKLHDISGKWVFKFAVLTDVLENEFEATTDAIMFVKKTVEAKLSKKVEICCNQGVYFEGDQLISADAVMFIITVN